MPNAFNPLTWNVRIVNPDGTPTRQFMQMLQDALRAIDSGSGDITAFKDSPFVMMGMSAETLNERVLTAGTAIDVIDGGPGSTATVRLEDTAVTPDTYGDAVNIPQITVDQQGRITSATDIPVSIPSGGVDVEDEGSPVITGATTLNFTGNVVVTDAGGGVAEINIPEGDPAWKVDAVGTGASQDVTLPFSGLTDEEVLVFVNGIRYEVDEYSISGTTLTLTTNASGDSIEIVGTISGISGGGGGTPWGFSPPLASDFTSTIGSTPPTLTDDSDVGLIVELGTAANSDVIRLATKALPSPGTDFSVTTKIVVNGISYNFAGIGLGIGDSVSNRVQLWGLQVNNDNRIVVANFNTPSGYGGSSPFDNGPYVERTLWFRITRIGTTLDFYVSSDGKTWVHVLSASETAWMSNAPDYIGVGGFYNRTGLYGDVSMSVPYWSQDF